MVTFGALSGEIGAELTEGNFWQGAVIRGIVAGLNHAIHQNISKQESLQYLKKHEPKVYEIIKELVPYFKNNPPVFTGTDESYGFNRKRDILPQC